MSQKHTFPLLDGEKAYQCYAVTLKWAQDIGDMKTDGYGPAWFDGLPDGRFWNSTGWTEMPGEPKSTEAIAEETKAIHTPKIMTKYADANPSDITVTVRPTIIATWCQGWFSHWTWDVGLSDAEILQSFGQYVSTIEAINRDEGKVVDGLFREPYCLMGAEDLYRWRGSDGKGARSDNQTDPPCRCSSCKKRGIVTIDH